MGLATIVVQLMYADVDWRQAVLRMAAALVPMVPEGLILLTSTAFALGVIRLGRRQCLVQELPAIEGLARVDVVCADKTGTLTENGMRCRTIEPLGGRTDAEVTEVLAQLVAADPHPNASMQAIGESVKAAGTPWTPTARALHLGQEVVGDHVRRAGIVGAGRARVLASGAIAERAEEIAAEGLRVLLVGRAASSVDAEQAPGRSSRSRW